jgi:outer membrane lipoprotein SlyB
MNSGNWVLAAGMLALTGCETYYGEPDRTGTGALAGGAIGATSGAIIGSQSGRGGEGALIGGAIGVITGGLIGHAMDQQERARLQAQAPQTYQRVEERQPLRVVDVKAMSQSGVSDEVIISQIRNTRTIYHLSSADIIDLHRSGVSSKVIDFMINTPSTAAADPPEAGASPTVVYQAPPPPQTEIIIAAPAPGYVWIGGEWIWNRRWVWIGGHWALPPRPHAVWVSGTWGRGRHGWVHAPGHWK